MATKRPLARELWATLALTGLTLLSTGVEGTAGFANVVLLGHLSTLALAGAELGSGMLILVGTLAGGGAVTLEPLVAQAYARSDWDRINTGLRKGTLAVTAVCVPSSLLVLAGSFGLERVGVDPHLAHHARLLLIASLPTAVLQPAFAALTGVLTGLAAVKPMVRVVLVGTIIHVVAAAFLIHGDGALLALHLPAIGLPSLGVVGAGLASDLSTLVFLVGAYRVFRNTRRQAMEDKASGAAPRTGLFALPVQQEAEPGAPEIDPNVPVTMGYLLRMAIPVALGITFEVAASLVLVMIVGRLGAIAMSAYATALLVPDMTGILWMALAAAVASRVGWAVGAGTNIRVAVKAALLLSLFGGVLFAGIVLVVPASVLARIVSNDVAVIDATAPLFLASAPLLVLLPFSAVLSSILRAASDFDAPAAVQTLGAWLRVILAYVFAVPFGLGVLGVWLGYVVGVALSVVALFIRARTTLAKPIRQL